RSRVRASLASQPGCARPALERHRRLREPARRAVPLRLQFHHVTGPSAAGASAYGELCRKHLARSEFRTRPQPKYECPLAHLAEETPRIPKLLRAYLSVGAKICGPPALDRE